MVKLAELKTILFYIVSLLGLFVATSLFTRQDNWADAGPLPPATPAGRQTPLPTPTYRPSRTPTPTPDPEACVTTPRVPAYAYRPGAPLTTTLRSNDLDSARLVISGRLYASDCRTPLPEALIELWQTDAGGHYDRSDDFILRARLHTDLQGRYSFTTTMPGRYTSGSEPLPAHIHYRVSYRDYEPLPTQLSFKGDPFIPRFPFIRPALVTTLTRQTGPDGPFLSGQFNLVLPVPPPPTPALYRARGN